MILSRRSTLTLVLAASLLLPAATKLLAADTETATKTKGYSCVLMGHSFFAPTARAFAKHPVRSGFGEHRQTVAFRGGAGGSPGRLWKTLPEDGPARRALKSGEVDLVGLTFYPEVGSTLADYRKWVDLAREANPETRFFIHIPWPRFNGRKLDEYEKTYMAFEKGIHGLVDDLREAYPETTFFCIPQGRLMIELRRLHERGELPEVELLMRPDRESTATCLFRDRLGHGGRLPTEMSALLWLAIVYDVDLTEDDYDTKTKADLKTVIMKIVAADPYAKQGK